MNPASDRIINYRINQLLSLVFLRQFLFEDCAPSDMPKLLSRAISDIQYAQDFGSFILLRQLVARKMKADPDTFWEWLDSALDSVPPNGNIVRITDYLNALARLIATKEAMAA